ncbi:hypothetical protein FAIPA1_160069 [Frankia sp. AiPs1]
MGGLSLCVTASGAGVRFRGTTVVLVAGFVSGLPYQSDPSPHYDPAHPLQEVTAGGPGGG